MSERKGWVKLHRKSIDSSVFNNETLWKVFTYCMMKAQFKEAIGVVGYQEIPLLPGQFIFGRKVASKQCHMSEQKIRTSMEVLSKREILTIKTTNKFSIVTICNWELYQGDDNENNQVTNQQLTNNQPTTNHIEEGKEDKEDNNIYKARGVIPAFDYDNRFKPEHIMLEKQTIDIIHYFNETFGKSVQDEYPNRYFISDRLKDGATLEDCKRVVETKSLDPEFKPQWKCIDTIFNKKNFAKYLNESPEDYGYVKTEPQEDQTCQEPEKKEPYTTAAR